jgi:hypothetical protein
MKEQQKSRRSFFLKTAGIAAAAALTGWFGFSQKKKKETVKMLTQDGRLVEIDKELISGTNKKIGKEEIHTWVKNKTTSNKIN